MRLRNRLTSSGQLHQVWTVWLVACGLPAAAWGAVLFVTVDPHGWLTISRPILRALVTDALLYGAAGALLAAPLAGVVLGSRDDPNRRRRGASHAALSVAWPLAVAVLLFVGTSAGLTMLAAGMTEGAATFVLTSHITLAAVTLALASFGAFCGRLFSDPLDAAACSLGLVIVAACGLLLAGASVADAPNALIDIAATASPLVAIASAAHVDVVRMDVLYRISPLAHMQFEYPSWYAASASYGAVTVACFLGLTWTCRTRRQPSATSV